ncbi:MAG: UvrD-helicase domain-containing protein [Bryobacteraceae bacterium]|nr:UvrD-helicase domain-containing protein [Bryobacteraceae bacterium]
MNPAFTPSGDELARRRIRASLHESLIVEAAAGTGKTTELVKRIVAVIAAGARIGSIVAVTFTHKAAGELKLRLRQEIDETRAAAADPEVRSNLERALAQLERASIGTIHSFCAQLLRERPVEAGVDPAFEELAEADGARLYQRAFRLWLENRLNEDSPALARAFARLAWRDQWETGEPGEQLQFAGRKLVEWRDFTAPWRREPFDRKACVDVAVQLVEALTAVARKVRRNDDALYRSLRPAFDFEAWRSRAEAASPRDYDQLEALLVKLPARLNKDFRKGTGQYGEAVTREDVLQKREEVIRTLAAFARHADADLAAGLRDEMSGLVAGYAQLKRVSGKLDFVDLLLLSRDLVRGNPSVREYFQRKFSHIFVDEFQDTDPLQAELLLLLSAGDPAVADWRQVTPAPGKFFAVGDPKQSIYKFRRADVVLYHEIRASLMERGVGLVNLSRGFRSSRPLQLFVNAAFAPEMTGDPVSGQAGYVPLEEHLPAFESQPAIVALPVPRPYGHKGITKSAINDSLPGAVCAYAEWLVRRSNWRVRDPEDPATLTALEARHIAILFRRFVNNGRDVTRDYVRGLEDRGLAHLLVGSKSYHHREEVETVRAALAAIEWPSDELSVFAALKGPLFAIGDAALLRFRALCGRFHPFVQPPPELDPPLRPVASALALLAALHRRRNHRPFADTVNELLEETRAHAGFVLRPGGHQVLANVYRVVDLARNFEIGGGVSFRAFVEELEAQAEKTEAGEAPVLEEGADGVRLMTVHTAKGLEFPVVILADMSANLASPEPDRYIDAARGLCATRLLRCAPWELSDHQQVEHAREEAEGIRVAYVAATRARDLLVVPAIGDDQWEGGWLRPLAKALYPENGQHRKPRLLSPGCPKFGDASIIPDNRPPQLSSGGECSVRPGLHQPGTGGHEVVWWDPSLLDLASDPARGLKSEDLLAKDQAGVAGQGAERYRRWSAARESDLDAAARPRHLLVVASLTSVDPPAPQQVEIVRMPGAARPAGRRFGLLLHAVMRDVPWTASPAEIQAIAGVHGRMLGATEEECEAAVDRAQAALAGEWLRRARSAARAHRELPLTVPAGDGRVLEGILDVAFLEPSGWIILDFKTDRDVEAARDRYLRQLSWYAWGLARASGAPARAVQLSL